MWYEAFGWPQNPFSIRPSPNVVGLEETKETLLQDLLSGTPTLLLGPTGMGKTSLLLWLMRKLRETRFPSAYLNLHDLPQPQTAALVRRIRGSALLRRLHLSPGAILLLDEGQDLEPQAGEWLKVAFDRGLLFSFVIAAVAEPALPQALRARIGPNVYQLKELSLPERIALLKARMDGKNPFTEDALTLLAEAAGSSPRALLQAAELVCKRLAFKAELHEPITVDDLAPSLLERPLTPLHPHATELPVSSKPAPPSETNATNWRATTSPTASHSPGAPLSATTAGDKSETKDKEALIESVPRAERDRTADATRRDKRDATNATPKLGETRHESSRATVSPQGRDKGISRATKRDKRDETNETKGSETKVGSVSRSVAREKSSPDLSPMQRELLQALQEGPRTIRELCELLHSPPGSVRQQLSRLRRSGLVEVLPHSRPKKFSLTAKARLSAEQN